MADTNVNSGSGVILLSTEWAQSGEISLYSDIIRYNEYCPTDPLSYEKCVTGCTNTAAAQILYYWIQNSDFTLLLQLTESDSYTSMLDDRTILIDATEATAQENGYLSFAEVNQYLADFTLESAEDIAALCFACGVVQKANYTSAATSTAWDSGLFQRAGIAGCTQISSYDESYNTNPYFFTYVDNQIQITEAGYEVLIDELLAGRPVGTSYVGHALIFDGYDTETDKFHINFGWGGYRNGWYSREDICQQGYYQFLLDISPEYDGSPILATDPDTYGTGTFLRGIEQLQGIFEADTLTVQTDGTHLELSFYWRFEKSITINNFNSEVSFTSCYGITSSGDITINGFSGAVSVQDSQYSPTAVMAPVGTTSFKNATGSIAARGDSAAYTIFGDSVSLQNFSGSCIAAAAGDYYASYAVDVSNDPLEITLNDGKIYAGFCSDDSSFVSLQQALGIYGDAGIAAASKYNSAVLSNFYSVNGSEKADSVELKNYSVLQGCVSLGGGTDELSVLGGSYVYAPDISGVETLTVDSTSSVCGLFYGSDMVLNLILTEETSSAGMIHILTNTYNFTSALKNQTFNVDLRGAADGEYVLMDADGAAYSFCLSSLSAKINTGKKTFTLNCGETANHVTLKKVQDKLVLVLSGFAGEKKEALLFQDSELLSVTSSVSNMVLSGDGTDSLRLTNGGTASFITVDAGGDLSVSGSGTATGTTVNAYGFLAVNRDGRAVDTVVKENGILNIGESAVHAGSLTIEENAVVRAEETAVIDFTIDGLAASVYQGINDISRISGTPVYTVTLSEAQSSGTYTLAGNAADFSRSITLQNSSGDTLGELTAGSSFELDGKTYALACNDGNLQLAVSITNVVTNPAYTESTEAGGGCSTRIEEASATKSYIGGELLDSEKTDIAGSYTVELKDGDFAKTIAGGDAVKAEADIVRTGDVTLAVEGGSFGQRVSGGMYYCPSTGGDGGSVTLKGNVSLELDGGTFSGRVYGGCNAKSDELGNKTTIVGNVNLTVDADSDFNIGNHIVAGSRGEGVITGDAVVTFTGNAGSGAECKLKFAANSVVFGGCSGDRSVVYDDGEKVTFTSIEGDRKLVFSAFTGDFDAQIMLFKTVVLKNDAQVNFTDDSLNMWAVEEWNFEYGCGITGFRKNEFENDTLSFNLGSWDGAEEWTVVTGAADGLADLAEASAVYFGNNAAHWENDCWTDGSYKLSVVAADDTQSSMILAKLS